MAGPSEDAFGMTRQPVVPSPGNSKSARVTCPSMEVGLWRSRLGDTHPHIGMDVDLDYWPQGTHAVSEVPALVLCATGGGGGAQQAMFRRDLDPLLARAVKRWTAGPCGTPGGVSGVEPGAQIGALFAAIQDEFEQLRTPAWADEFQASAVAVVVEPGRCAIANVGVERAWLVRDGRCERVSQDDTIGGDHPDVASWLNELPAAWFGRFRGAPARWHTRELALCDDDVLVLASGACDLGLDEERLGAEVTRVLAETPAPADAARRLGEYAAAVERWIPDRGDDAVRRARWRVHSRLALAIVRPRPPRRAGTA